MEIVWTAVMVLSLGTGDPLVFDYDTMEACRDAAELIEPVSNMVTVPEFSAFCVPIRSFQPDDNTQTY